MLIELIGGAADGMIWSENWTPKDGQLVGIMLDDDLTGLWNHVYRVIGNTAHYVKSDLIWGTSNPS
tara:strand:+ start:4314 stop:4511 length:198 start_codon:yes stop_codon:yes gene_type:complete